MYPLKFFSTSFLGTITSLPQFIHCSRKSIPTLSNFHSFAPQGCFFFILITSPTLKSICFLCSCFPLNFRILLTCLIINFTIAENIFCVKDFSYFRACLKNAFTKIYIAVNTAALATIPRIPPSSFL